MFKTIGACLRVSSGPSETAARFDEENYGLVHSAETDVEHLKKRIKNHLTAAGKAGKNVAVAASTVTPDVEHVGEGDLLRAMHYTIKAFCEAESASDAIGNLSENLDKYIAQASAKMSSFRDIVSASRLMAFRVKSRALVRQFYNQHHQ